MEASRIEAFRTELEDGLTDMLQKYKQEFTQLATQVDSNSVEIQQSRSNLKTALDVFYGTRVENE